MKICFTICEYFFHHRLPQPPAVFDVVRQILF